MTEWTSPVPSGPPTREDLNRGALGQALLVLVCQCVTDPRLAQPEREDMIAKIVRMVDGPSAGWPAPASPIL